MSVTEMREEVKNGVVGVDVATFHIYIDGKYVDTAYGTEWYAWGVYREWVEAIANDQTVDQYADVPLDEIPDSYWKNGDIAQLKLDDDSIPFDGRPMAPTAPITQADEYALEVAW